MSIHLKKYKVIVSAVVNRKVFYDEDERLRVGSQRNVHVLFASEVMNQQSNNSLSDVGWYHDSHSRGGNIH